MNSITDFGHRGAASAVIGDQGEELRIEMGISEEVISDR
jgi:hypothetical protein